MLQQTGTVPAVPDGLSAEDAAVFERVWRRVMAGREQLPSTAEPETERRNVGLVPAEGAPPANLMSGQTEQMPEHMRAMAMGWRESRSLAGRAAGSAARLLNAMAAEERRQLSRMAAAWYIMTGQRWRPEESPAAASVSDLMEGLRNRWLHKHRMAEMLEGAAQGCAGSELAGLYADLAGRERAHAAQLLGILERML